MQKSVQIGTYSAEGRGDIVAGMHYTGVTVNESKGKNLKLCATATLL